MGNIKSGIIDLKDPNYDLLKHEFDGIKRRIESLEKSDVDIRHVLRVHEQNASEMRKLVREHEAELKALKNRQREVDDLLSKFSEHIKGVVEP